MTIWFPKHIIGASYMYLMLHVTISRSDTDIVCKLASTSGTPSASAGGMGT